MVITVNNFIVTGTRIKTDNIVETINHLETRKNKPVIVWKNKPSKIIAIVSKIKKFHEKSKYVNDMLNYEELSYHRKDDYKKDQKTSLHSKLSYKLDIFGE